MAKSKSVYICQNCGTSYPKWSGQCGSCGQWNTLVEEVQEGGNSRANSLQSSVSDAEVQKNLITFSQVDPLKSAKRRFSTHIDELDRVLGSDNGQSGVVQGAVMLIGGEPGIGKSTLLTQMVLLSLAHYADMKVLYVCGEENPHQISMRIKRLLAAQSEIDKNAEVNIVEISSEKSKKEQESSLSKKVADINSRLLFGTSTNIAVISEQIKKEKPDMVVVDSIQTVTSPDLTGAPGSVGQIRACADELTHLAKSMNIPLWIVGHVTKEGQIAGPKVLEHIVDSVLEFSGERTGELRLLRAIKNRFGATDEVGVFKMTENGFVSVKNPTELFLEHSATPVPGSASVCVMEGTRPLIIEIQALLIKSQLAMPRRIGSGLPLSKIQMLSAILEKHCHLPLGTTDIFASLVGGFSTKEPSIDLGMAIAMASSLKNKAVPANTVFIGEVGLLGEIRSVPLLERREKEAKRLGFTNVISLKKYKTITQLVRALFPTT